MRAGRDSVKERQNAFILDRDTGNEPSDFNGCNGWRDHPSGRVVGPNPAPCPASSPDRRRFVRASYRAITPPWTH